MKRAVFFLAFALASGGCAAEPADPMQPKIMRWGASAAEIEKALDGKCANGFVNRPIEPPFLPAVKDRQVQIDCDGFEFLDAPRWAEFVIGDDRLQMVWIRVEPGDEEAAVAALTRAYGLPLNRNENYIAFVQGQAAWRFEPAEVLFYSPELASWLEPDFAAR